MRAPRLTFHLAAPGTAATFSVGADAIGAIPTWAIDPGRYPGLVAALTQAIRETTDFNDAAALASFTLTVICLHPLYGEDVRQSLGAALRMFPTIVIAVLLDGGRIGFSVGDAGSTEDLRPRLAGLRGASESGTVGAWPAQVAAVQPRAS